MGRATAALLLVGLASLAGGSTGNAQSETVPPQVYVDILQQYWTELDEGTRPQSVCIAATADSFIAADRPEAHELRHFLEEGGFPVHEDCCTSPSGRAGEQKQPPHRLAVTLFPARPYSRTWEGAPDPELAATELAFVIELLPHRGLSNKVAYLLACTGMSCRSLERLPPDGVDYLTGCRAG